MTFLAIWVVCSIASWFVLAATWRSRYDMTIRDAFFFGIVSLYGPMSLISAVLIGLIYSNGGKTIWRKK